MQKPHYFLILDHDVMKFNVLGPILSDEKWTNKIADLQGAGRHINCSTFPADGDRAQRIAEYATNHPSYTYSDELLVPELAEA